MKDNRNVEFISFDGKEIDPLLWYITLIAEEITLFSNNYYLYMDDNKVVKGDQYMKTWKYREENNQFYIYYENENNILNIEGNNAIVSKAKKKDIALFHFIDYFEFN